MKKLLYILFPLILFGCKSASVVEMIEIHDTLRIVQTDTIVKEVKVEVRDTIRIKVTDSVIVNIDKDGNVSKEHYHDEDRLQTTDYGLQTTEERKRTEDRLRTTDYRQLTTEEEEKPSAISKAKGKIVDVLVVLFFSVISFMMGWIIRAVKDK